MEACAEGCRKYTGASPCVAWTFSSPENETPGTCQLKAAVGPVHLTDQNVVAGHMAGGEPATKAVAMICSSAHVQAAEAGFSQDQVRNGRLWTGSWTHSLLPIVTLSSWPVFSCLMAAAQGAPASNMKNYTVEYDRGYAYNDLHLGMTRQTTPDGCAAACTARVTNTACVAWTWAPPTHPSTPGLCRLLSARGSDVQQEPGLVSGYMSGDLNPGANALHAMVISQPTC